MYLAIASIGTESVFQPISMKETIREASTMDNAVWSLVYIVVPGI